MSKYIPLWEYIEKHNLDSYTLTFEEIKKILGFEIDRAFLLYKTEAQEFGYMVGKISKKNKTVEFKKIR